RKPQPAATVADVTGPGLPDGDAEVSIQRRLPLNAWSSQQMLIWYGRGPRHPSPPQRRAQHERHRVSSDDDTTGRPLDATAERPPRAVADGMGSTAQVSADRRACAPQLGACLSAQSWTICAPGKGTG